MVVWCYRKDYNENNKELFFVLLVVIGFFKSFGFFVFLKDFFVNLVIIK